MKSKPVAFSFYVIPQIILPQNHYLETLEIKEICIWLGKTLGLQVREVVQVTGSNFST